MFGNKAPLMQTAGEGDGGGGTTPGQQGTRNAVGSVAKSALAAVPGVGPAIATSLPVLDWGYETATGERGLSDNADVEPAQAPADLENQPTQQGADRGGKRLGSPTGGPTAQATKAGPANFTLKGTLAGGVSADVTAAKVSRDERIRKAEMLQRLAQLRALGVSENALRDYAVVADEDEQFARQLADTHFTRAQARMDQLNKDVDDARKMKVDPYRWHKSIGRGGRTAAAFAALTGGFAAGHMNPNTALNLMDQSIERDIAAQKTDIQTTLLGLQQARGLGADERALYEQHIQTMQHVRAMNYASTLGRIKAAQQNAITEAHRVSLQVARDHYESKLLGELAKLQQEILQIEVNAPLRGGVKQLQALKAQALELQRQLQPALAGNQTLAQGPVTLSDGTTTQDMAREVGTARTLTPIPVGPAPGRASRVAQRTPRTSRRIDPPAGARETATSPGEQASAPATPQPIEDAESGMSRLETQEEANARVAAEQARTQDEGRAAEIGTPRTMEEVHIKARAGALTPQDVKKVIKADRDLGVLPAVVPYESYARWTAHNDPKQTGTFSRIPTWSQGINAIARGAAPPHGGMVGQEDAEVVARYLPAPEPKFFKKGVNDPQYIVLARQYDYRMRYPEVFEQPSTLGGERNAIHTAAGTYIVRQEAREDAKAVAKAKSELIKADRLASDAYETAKTIGRAGISGFFAEDGSFQIPGITSSDEARLEIFTQSIAQAMNFIKTHDPTARISDQDLKIGEKAAAAYKTGGKSFVDFVQRVMGFDLNQTDQAQNFLRLVAVGAQKISMTETYDTIVPSYESVQEFGRRAAEVEPFLRGGPAQ